MATTGDRVVEIMLRDYRAKAKGHDEKGQHYRSWSPLRSDSNSDSFGFFVRDDGESGGYNDHVNGETGSLYDLARKLGVEIEVQNTKRRYENMADYAKAHYIEESLLLKLGWKEVVVGGRPAIAYQLGGVTRFRYLDGKEPYYNWEVDPKTKKAKTPTTLWYGLLRGSDKAIKMNMPLVVGNGEITSIVADFYGMPVCGVGGGERKWSDKILAEFIAAYPPADGRVVVLAYDCDETGRKVAQEVGGQLTDAGYEVLLSEMGLSKGGDLCDFSALHAPNAYTTLLSVSVPFEPDFSLIEKVVKQIDADATTPEERAEQELRRLDKMQGQIDRARKKLKPVLSVTTGSIDERFDAQVEVSQSAWPRTDIPTLDNAIFPFEPELYVVLGATGMGKSWMMVSFIRAFAKFGRGMLITTEMRLDRYYERLVAAATRIPVNEIHKRENIHLVSEARELFKAGNHVMLDEAAPSVKDVRDKIDKANDEGYPIEWLVVDSASRMRDRFGPVYENQSAVADGLQTISRHYDIPVVATVQVARDVSDRKDKMPELTDAYGSGVWDHNVGVGMGILRPSYYGDPTYLPLLIEGRWVETAFVRLLKHRNQDFTTDNLRLSYVRGCGFYAPINTQLTNLNEVVRAALDEPVET